MDVSDLARQDQAAVSRLAQKERVVLADGALPALAPRRRADRFQALLFRLALARAGHHAVSPFARLPAGDPDRVVQIHELPRQGLAPRCRPGSARRPGRASLPELRPTGRSTRWQSRRQPGRSVTRAWPAIIPTRGPSRRLDVSGAGAPTRGRGPVRSSSRPPRHFRRVSSAAGRSGRPARAWPRTR